MSDDEEMGGGCGGVTGKCDANWDKYIERG